MCGSRQTPFVINNIADIDSGFVGRDEKGEYWILVGSIKSNNNKRILLNIGNAYDYGIDFFCNKYRNANIEELYRRGVIKLVNCDENTVIDMVDSSDIEFYEMGSRNSILYVKIRMFLDEEFGEILYGK